jgi:hypothetical protein
MKKYAILLTISLVVLMFCIIGMTIGAIIYQSIVSIEVFAGLGALSIAFGLWFRLRMDR